MKTSMYSSLWDYFRTRRIAGKFCKAPSATSTMSLRKWKRTGSISDSVISGPKISAHSCIEYAKDRRTFHLISVTIYSYIGFSLSAQNFGPRVLSTAGKL
jgi:hypothetical protein